jgi:plastocyanin
MPAMLRTSRLLLFVLALLSGPAWSAVLSVSVTDAAGKPLEGAVVTVSVAGAPKVAPSGASAEMTQQNRQFAPRSLIVQAGTSVHFPNLDTVRHHVYSFSPAKTFELKLYAGTPSAPVVFDKTGVVVIGCNIHDRMSGWIVVVDTPYFAKTDAAGQARIDVPDGEHLVRVSHPQQPDGSVPFEKRARAGAPIAVRLAFTPDA